MHICHASRFIELLWIGYLLLNCIAQGHNDHRTHCCIVDKCNRIKFVRFKVKSQKFDIKKITLHLLLFDQFIFVLPNFINVYISMARTVNIYIVLTQTFSIYYNGAMKAEHITNWLVSSTPNGNYYIFNTNEAIFFSF